MADVLRLEMPVEFGLELGAVVGLDDEHSKRQTTEHFVDEPDGGALVARVVDLQDPNSGAIVNGGELIEPPARPGNSFQELHIELQSVTRQWLLIALPPFPVRSVFLIRRQTVQAMPLEDAMHRGHRDRDVMEPEQIRCDPARSEVIVLAEIENLADYVAGCRSRRPPRRPRPIAQPGVAVLRTPPLPFVEPFP